MSKQSRMFGEEEKEVELAKNIPLKDANEIANTLLTLNDSWCQKIDVVGSIRRKKATINDIDFVVVCTDKNWLILKENMKLGLRAKVVASGDKIHRFVIPLEMGDVQVDFYRATEDTYGIYKLIRTGSAEHNIYLAKLAIKNGMRLQYSRGLIKGEEVVAGKFEQEVFDQLGLPFIHPPEREIVNEKPVWKK